MSETAQRPHCKFSFFFFFSDVHDNDFDATTERPPWANPQHPDYKGAGKNPNDPIFDNNLVTNVTVQLGGTAFLHCRVRNLGERPVSNFFYVPRHYGN